MRSALDRSPPEPRDRALWAVDHAHETVNRLEHDSATKRCIRDAYSERIMHEV
jgi:hypothetical protein